MSTIFKPTSFQTEIFQYVLFERGNAVIEAVAGSGKTTTILKVIEKIKGRSKLKIVFVAFNKHIAEELKTKLPSTIQSVTLHGIGLSWVRRANKGQEPKIDQYGIRTRKLIQELSVSENWFDYSSSILSEKEIKDEISIYCKSLNDLIRLCKLNMSTTQNAIQETALKHGFNEFGRKDFERVALYFKRIIERQDLTNLTFEDMIFYPAIGIVPVTKFDFVFIDECQDLNKAQQACINRMLRDTGRFIAVGDPYQAIYGFTGADSSSFEEFKGRPNTKLLPLSECFRCGKEIVNFARTLVPHIEFRNDSPQGIIRYGSYKEVTSGDYVLCRLNAPLVNLCLDYIREGINAKILGSKIGEDLVVLVQSQLVESKQSLLLNLTKMIHKLKNSLIASGLDEDDVVLNARYTQLNDQITTIRVIAERCSNSREIIARIKSIFDSATNGIVLSSIHKAKGLEADRVFILADALMPLRKAVSDWEKRQETNLIYVAYTRAKKELIFINDYYEEYLTTNINIQKSLRLENYLGY